MIRTAQDIRRLRERLRLTREEMATRIGVSYQTVCRWEQGKGKPSRMGQKLLEAQEHGGQP